MSKITFHPPSELEEELRLQAAKRNKTLSQYLTLTLAQYLNFELPEGCFKTGPKGPRMTPQKQAAPGGDYAF